MNMLFVGVGFDPEIKPKNEVYTLIDLSAGERNESPVILFDLDGTLSDSTDRNHLVEGTRKDFDQFYDLAKNDKLNRFVYDEMAKYWNEGARIVILTGRPDKYMFETLRWLHANNVLPMVDCMFMKHGESFESNVTFKQQCISCLADAGDLIVRGYDDMPKVRAMFEELKIEAIDPSNLGITPIWTPAGV